jgi:pimeloyl-ACP methyl ester carboxylesterase
MARVCVPGAVLALVAAGTLCLRADDGDRVLVVDHYVRARSAVPAIEGQTVQLYVRERVRAATVLRAGSLADRVVLFVHGAGTPAEVAFDVPYEDYSWMAFLARAGFDVFSVDMTGYGRSTRPTPMNDPCNVARSRQEAVLVPSVLSAPCPPSYPRQMTTLASDWQDIDAAVDYIRALRRVDRVSLVGWSLGGPRTGGYALRHPSNVHRIVMLAPAYNRVAPAAPPAHVPGEGPAVDIQSRADFDANWDRQLECEAQHDRAIRDVIWAEMLASDPIGATWGPGVRRAPTVTSWGFTASTVAALQAPTLMIAPVHDRQVVPERVKELYTDLGARQKVLVDLGCASHNAMWERAHTILFRASLEWLERGTVAGLTEGIVRLGY